MRQIEGHPVKAIFFDLGGVVVSGSNSAVIETLAVLTAVPRSRLRRFYGPFAEPLHKGEETSVSLTRRACRYFGISAPSADTIHRRFVSVYRQHRKVLRPVLGLVRELRRRYVVGLVSDIVPEHAAVNAQWGVFSHFKPAVLSCSVGLCKPGGAIFRYALKKARVEPQASVFIDDLPENVRGARRVGMRAIRFMNIRQLKRDLKKLGVLLR